LSGNPESIEERVTAVEVSFKFLREDIQKLSMKHDSLSSRFSKLSEKISTFGNHISSVKDKCEFLAGEVKLLRDAVKRISPGMSGKDKAALVIAIISGIVSIVVVIIQNIPV